MLSLQAATIDAAKDPLYAKPVTVELPMAPLKAVVAAISKASGQPLDVSGQVGDWKATVLVRDLPAGRAMEALADALGLVWRRDPDAVRLGWPEGASAAVSAYRREEADRAKTQAERSLVVNAYAVPPGGRGAYRRPRRGAPIPTGATKASYARFEPNLLVVETGGAEPPSRLDPVAPAGDSAFAKATLAWPSVPQALSAAWSVPVSPALASSKWEGGAHPLADFLVAWHEASHLPVVADAFRVAMRSATPSASTAIGSLQSLAGAERLSLRVAGGVARLRHPGFWRLREQEVSESAWAGLERGTPNLAALSSFAGRLSAPQAASFRSLESPLSLVSTAALRQAYPALLLWNALPGAARTSLLAGRPVGLAEVKGAASAYGYALREAPYYDGGDPAPVLALAPARTGLFGQSKGRLFELRLAGERGDGVFYLLPL